MPTCLLAKQWGLGSSRFLEVPSQCEWVVSAPCSAVQGMQVVFFRSKKSPEDLFCFARSSSAGQTLGWGTASHLGGNHRCQNRPRNNKLTTITFFNIGSGNTLCPVPVQVPPSLSKLPQICWSLSSPPCPPCPCPPPPCLSQNVSSICFVLPLPLPRRLLAG